MNAPRNSSASLARKTSLALVAFALVNVAVIPLLLGCDSGHPGMAQANAATQISTHAAVDLATDPYLPNRHTLHPDARDGNVATYEHD